SREERTSLRERVLVPGAARIASVVLRLNRRETLENVQQRLLAAGMSAVPPSSFLAAKGVLAGVGGLFGFVLVAATHKSAGVFMVLVLAAIGWIAPGFVVSARARRRRDEVQAQLPDALDLLAVSVEAGLGFDAAISKLTDHMAGPLIDEFAPALAAFVRAIIQADQLGISLGRILRVQAVDSRLKRQAAAEEKAMKAPIKMLFPTVVFIFPAMFIVVLGPALISLSKLFGF